MGKNGFAVVIPVYKKVPDLLEKLGLERISKTFRDRDMFLCMPNGLDAYWYEKNFKNIKICRFEDEYFFGLDSYNRMMLNISFYQKWLRFGYEKILICQLDVYVISDRLNDFFDLPYDYIGAPIFRLECDKPFLYGGNGGFSLRSLYPCMNTLEKHSNLLKDWGENEDEFFSYCGEKFPKEFRVAPLHYSSLFAFDRFARILYKYNQGHLPIALHGWYSYDPAFSMEVLRMDEKMRNICALEDIRKYEEERFLSFVSNHQPVILYGAGLWGKVFFHFLCKHNISVHCFAVSDNHVPGENYHGVEVRCLSELTDDHLVDGMVFSVSRRFMGDALFSDIVRRVKNMGYVYCFEPNVVLFNLSVESWLEAEDVF